MNFPEFSPKSAVPALLEALQAVLDGSSGLDRQRPEWVQSWLVRWVLRLAFLMLAEQRRMLPMHNRIYRESYSVTETLELLRQHHRQDSAGMAGQRWAFSRLTSLCRLVHQGATHPQLTFCGYGGSFFREETPSDTGPHDKAVLRLLTAMSDPRLGLSSGGYETSEIMGTLYQVLVGLKVTREADRWLLGADEGLRRAQGTYYTPAALVQPLVRRVLAPLVCPDSQMALPEQILSLRILDPAAGSGTFLTSALHYLVQKLMDSIEVHRRAHPVGEPSGAWKVVLDKDLSLEIPGSPQLEPGRKRLQALLKRLVSQQCLYGVDLDPTAVEIARLALWLESLDPGLPFTFLDHCVKVGNSLVGAPSNALWQYPLAAALTAVSTLPEPERAQQRSSLQRFARHQKEVAITPCLPGLDGPFSLPKLRRKLASTLERIWQMHEAMPEAKQHLYEQAFVNSPEALAFRRRLDSWCALWFWPRTQAREFPSPEQWQAGDMGYEASVRDLATGWRFFHWELEFPQVFWGAQPGFDAVLANPPWERPETANPVADAAGIHSLRQFLEGSSRPGGPLQKTYDRLNRPHQTRHCFLWQGDSGFNLYQLFLERAIRCLKPGGRLGMVIPSGFTTDAGAAPLRNALFQETSLEWLVSLSNRRKWFDIDSRFGFLAVVASRGGPTQRFRMVAEARNLDCLDQQVPGAPLVSREMLPTHSAGLLLPEFGSGQEFDLLRRLLQRHPPLKEKGPGGFAVTYRRELDMAGGHGRFQGVWALEQQGCLPDGNGVWHGPQGQTALPLVQGASFHAFMPWARQWQGEASGSWQSHTHPGSPARPKFLVPSGSAQQALADLAKHKLVLRRLARNSDERTLLASVVPGYPCGDKAPSLITRDPLHMLALCALLNSLVLDWACRCLGSGTNVDWHKVASLPLPDATTPGMLTQLAPLALALHPPHRLYHPLWAALVPHCPWIARRPPGGFAVTQPAARRLVQAVLDARIAAYYGVSAVELALILANCDLPSEQLALPRTVLDLPSRGFWRVDKTLPPEQRRTVMALICLKERLWMDSGPEEILLGAESGYLVGACSGLAAGCTAGD